MKRYLYWLSLPILLFEMACTDFIDVRPENATTYTNYFRTQKDAEALLTYLQVKIKSIAYGGVADRGIIADSDPNGWEVPNKLDPSMARAYLKAYYDVIHQADLILDNAHRFEITANELEPYLLQAYFAKGIAYFYLAMNFGEVPITKESTNFDKLPQSSISEVLDEAEKWALKAMDLPKYEDLVQQTTESRMKQYGSKGAAAALLAHLYAWRAGVEGKSEYWTQAEEYCRMIIEGEVGNYQLATTPEDVCVNVMYGNSDESIWELYNIGDETVYQGFNSFVGFPVITTSGYAPDNTWQPSIYKSTVREMYDKDDRRRNAYFWGTDADSVYLKYVDDEVIAATERGVDSVILAYDNQNIPRAYLYKYRYSYYTYRDSDPEPRFTGLSQNIVIWRLADIYLLRAECRARQGKTNAVEDLNEIRRRAYGNDNYSFPCAEDVRNGLSDNIQLAIFREREKELLHEGQRYYDIVRNGWCYLRGEDSYDYIRKEISEAYAQLTDQDIQDGALYDAFTEEVFVNNDLIRQNRYWNRRFQ